MSPSEILVVAVGLGLGYLLVSLLMGGKKNRDSRAENMGRPDSSQDAGTEGTPDAEPSDSQASEFPTWADVLGVSRFASEDEIRSAYRRLMSQYHPDKVAALGQELRDLAERKSKEIGSAYTTALQARGFVE